RPATGGGGPLFPHFVHLPQELREFLAVPPQQPAHVQDARAALVPVPRRRRPPPPAAALLPLPLEQAQQRPQQRQRQPLDQERPRHRRLGPRAHLLHAQPLLVVADRVLLAVPRRVCRQHLRRRQVQGAGDDEPRLAAVPLDLEGEDVHRHVRPAHRPQALDLPPAEAPPPPVDERLPRPPRHAPPPVLARRRQPPAPL